MKFLCKQLNNKFLALFLLAVAILLFMHWQLAMTVEFEYPFKVDAILSNVFSCFIDVTFFFVLSLLLTKGRVKGSLMLTFVLTAILSFCNVLYSRFFGHYLPNLAVTQLGNLNDGDVIRSILTGFRWQDVCYILIAVLFGWIYRCYDRQSLKTRYIRTLGWLWAAILAVVVSFMLLIGLGHDTSFEITWHRFFPFREQYNMAPNEKLFRSGFVRRAVVCYEDFFQKDLDLDGEQIKEIECEYSNLLERVTMPTVKDERNLIFIIVESYLSVTSDLKVDGKEITPFLNSLRHDSTVYYNGHLTSNINMGESSDGQFIYMSGLLPLKSEITVNLIKGKMVQGLPKVLARQGIIKQSHMIAPTSPTFWEQDTMNEIYGIEKMYSKFDYPKALHGNEDLNDEQIFDMASKIDTQTKEPFFSMVITMSMHCPYDKSVEHGFALSNQKMTPEYRNYLMDCHYTDQQLEKYIDVLKKNGIYDKSVIVIAADHHAHPSMFDMEEGDISQELPLYVINGGIDTSEAWTGPCNQLDVYTTLLDMFGVKTKWHGLGHTLLKSDYINSVSDNTQRLSDWIVRGNYFKDR